ncbi:MAG: hypothetical protein JWO52_4056 [Gammaproteobacteria bacterium]|nr:hypothetical protein [Gammaproteobacteria bacterium]
MAAIGNTTSAFSTSSSNTVTLAVPSGATTADCFLIAVDTQSSSATITWPSGFAEITPHPSEVVIGSMLRVAIKSATGSESGNFVATISGFFAFTALCAVVQGVSSTLQDAQGNAPTESFGSSISLVGASVSTGAANNFVVFVGAVQAGGTTATATFTQPSGFTKNATVDSGVGNALGLASFIEPTNGSVSYTGSMAYSAGDPHAPLVTTLVFVPAATGLTKRQTGSFDPTPGNGIGQGGNPIKIAVSFALDTLAGSGIAVYASIANTNGFGFTSCVDSNGNAFTQRTVQSNPASGCDSRVFTRDNCPVILAGFSGIVSSGTSTTLTIAGTPWTTNQFGSSAPYKNITSGDTGTVTSCTTNTLTISGMSQLPAAGQVFAVGGYILLTASGADDYWGAIAQECAGPGAVSYIAGSGVSAQGSFSSGTNNLSSGSAALGSNPAMAFGFCIGDVDAGATPYDPLADTTTGVVDDGHFLKFDLASQIVRAQHRLFSSPGTQDMKFSARNADHFQTHMVAFAGPGGPPPQAAVTRPGPGIQPGRQQTQFSMPPRGFIVPVTTLSGAAASGLASASGSMFSLQTSGGQGFVPQPGPGVGPFSNSQFTSAPLAVIAGAPQFLMAAPASSLASVSATLSQLQAWGAIGNSVVSVTAALSTLRSSGGSVSYLTQPGPGIGPFSSAQFVSGPRSTNTPFQQLVGAASGSSVTTAAANLLTSITMNAKPTGLGAAVTALTSGISMAATPRGAGQASGAFTAAILLNANAVCVAQSSPLLLTGIQFAANLTGLSYASVALGTGTSLTITAAGLASASAALLTQIPIASSPTGVGSAAAQLSTAPQFAAVGSSIVNASGGLSASIQCSAQAAGIAFAAPALLTSVILAGTATGLSSTQGTLSSGTMLSATGSAVTSIGAALSTTVAPYSAAAFGSASTSAQLNGNVEFAAVANSNSQVTARLLTVLQPPGEFADIRWLRAPRGGGVPYTEFFQGAGEKLWYAVNWEDWLASNWEPNSSATLGQSLRPTVPNGLEFVCTAIGQTGATEPLWPTYAGGVVIDGTAIWQGQPVSTASFDDTISGSAFSAPAGVLLDSGQVLSQRSYLIIDTTASVVGTDYDVLCTIDTSGGQQKIGKLRIKVR